MAKKKKNEIQTVPARRIFKKEIVVEVATGDIEKKDKINTELTKEILKSQAEKSEWNREKNAELKALRKSQIDNLNTIETGRENVAIDCYEDIDEQRLEMVTRRMMGEAPSEDDPILHEFTRPLTAQERQVALPEPEPEGGEDDDADGDPGMDENEDDAA
jgi:hypothetical protein